MKLFVWADPYAVSFGASVYFAVAETVEEARKIAFDASRYSYGEHEIDKIGEAAAQFLAGDPTRVLDVPCGEWHQWSE